MGFAKYQEGQQVTGYTKNNKPITGYVKTIDGKKCVLNEDGKYVTLSSVSYLRQIGRILNEEMDKEMEKAVKDFGEYYANTFDEDKVAKAPENVIDKITKQYADTSEESIVKQNKDEFQRQAGNLLKGITAEEKIENGESTPDQEIENLKKDAEKEAEEQDKLEENNMYEAMTGGYQTFKNSMGEKDSFYDPYKMTPDEPDMGKEFDFEVEYSNPKGSCAEDFNNMSAEEIEKLLYDSYGELDYLENNLYDVQKEARLTYDWDSVKKYKQRIANEKAKYKKILDAAVELSLAGEEFSSKVSGIVDREKNRRIAAEKRAASTEANRGNRIQKYADELKNYYDGMPEKVLNLLDDNGLFKERKSWGVIKDYFNTPFGKHLKNLWVNQFGKKESKMRESIFSKRDMSEDVVDYLERHQAMELVEDVEFVIPSYGAKSELKIKINKEKLKDKAKFLVRFTKYGIDPNEEGWEPSVQKLGYLLNKAIDFDDVVTETNNVGAFYLCLMNPKTNRHLKESNKRMKESEDIYESIYPIVDRLIDEYGSDLFDIPPKLVLRTVRDSVDPADYGDDEEEFARACKLAANYISTHDWDDFAYAMGFEESAKSNKKRVREGINLANGMVDSIGSEDDFDTDMDDFVNGSLEIDVDVDTNNEDRDDEIFDRVYDMAEEGEDKGVIAAALTDEFGLSQDEAEEYYDMIADDMMYDEEPEDFDFDSEEDDELEQAFMDALDTYDDDFITDDRIVEDMAKKFNVDINELKEESSIESKILKMYEIAKTKK